MGNGAPREAWGSRIGLILAAAGNAIGIGNLLRFPGQAAQNGGGAFMVPYIVCLVLFGLPMMWVAWTVGRYGGRFGHGTTPGMFDRMWRPRFGWPIAKYLGVLGVALPLIFCLYYTYIEAWCLGYSFFSLTGDFASSAERTVAMPLYFREFLGDAPTSNYFGGLAPAFIFLGITVALNVFVLYRGIAKGIELLAKVAVPMLFLFCLVLIVRVFTLDSERAIEGLNFLWKPNFDSLRSPGVWVAAAGQVFFTLSIGIGSLECYASYLRENDDVTLTGLTTASTNEFVEVIFGSLIAIPAAAVFFGSDPESLQGIASGGTFSIGMISMPETLREIPPLQVFGTIWFLLLFFAAFTSSVAVCQPVMAFLQDEAKIPRSRAAILVGIFWALFSIPLVLYYRYGSLDEMDRWAGTIGLVVFSAIEVVIFAWIFRLRRGWEEMHRGADIRVPKIFYPIMLVITPVCLLALLGFWGWDVWEGGKLAPKPKISPAVVDRASFPGRFEAPEQGPKMEEERYRELTDRIGAVAEQEGDQRFTVTIEIAGDGGTLDVRGVSGDEAVLAAFTTEELEAWLTHDRFGYRENRVATGQPVTVTLAVDVLDTAPWISLIRIMMILIALGFGVAVYRLWKTRGPPSPAAGEAEGVPEEEQ